MSCIAYYAPNVPDNPSTARYNHALAIAELADRSALITYRDKPARPVVGQYDAVKTVDAPGVQARAQQARTFADRFLDGSGADDGIYLTSFHYAPALSGWRSNSKWVVDVYDDPYQKIYRNPRSIHEIGVRLLGRMLDRADRAVHTVHPTTPHTFGKKQFFAVNGADVSHIKPSGRADDSGSLQGVCAGVKGGMDVLLRGLSKSDVDIELNVYGSLSHSDRRLASKLNVEEKVIFHGERDHTEVVETIEKADVGFCLLPEKTDWYYAHPIKIGEYLAGGTIPIASAYPGIRQLVRDTGILVEYDSIAIAESLTLISEQPRLRKRLHNRSRHRAEAVNWHDEREWFAKQVLFGNDAANPI